MSDQEDRMRGMFREHLEATYRTIKVVCGALPVPIELPDFGADILERIEAVGRAAELVCEQPLPSEPMTNAELMCHYWVAAAELSILDRIEPRSHRVASASVVLVTGHQAGLDFMLWFRNQRED
ncbi:hypothetical protein [Streptomyces sp. DH37]|uniref:hypothetical protein n=1 Tax=Streptomyces sp. DH37 TaxID=3040122 RepID=UPI0024429098|nr:hypothetical protein [Streptomyces sp. DH37]MDG9703783.1 hypothetical protein [Streptomyces sp. DH37]